jgi:hypothetical protein
MSYQILPMTSIKSYLINCFHDSRINLKRLRHIKWWRQIFNTKRLVWSLIHSCNRRVWCVVNDQPVGNPKRKVDEYSS